MKKSLVDALAQARKVSALYPDITVRVMDKPGAKAVLCAFDWIYAERVLAGYDTAAIFRAGEAVKKK